MTVNLEALADRLAADPSIKHTECGPAADVAVMVWPRCDGHPAGPRRCTACGCSGSSTPPLPGNGPGAQAAGSRRRAVPTTPLRHPHPTLHPPLGTSCRRTTAYRPCTGWSTMPIWSPRRRCRCARAKQPPSSVSPTLCCATAPTLASPRRRGSGVQVLGGRRRRTGVRPETGPIRRCGVRDRRPCSLTPACSADPTPSNPTSVTRLPCAATAWTFPATTPPPA